MFLTQCLFLHDSSSMSSSDILGKNSKAEELIAGAEATLKAFEEFDEVGDTAFVHILVLQDQAAEAVMRAASLQRAETWDLSRRLIARAQEKGGFRLLMAMYVDAFKRIHADEPLEESKTDIRSLLTHLDRPMVLE